MPVNRRRFILWSAFGTTCVLASWRLLSPSKGATALRLSRFSVNQSRILAALVTTITLERDTRTINKTLKRIDSFAKHLHVHDLRDLKLALLLFEQIAGLPLGKWSKFTFLEVEEQKEVVSRWSQGRWFQRLIVNAFKETIYLIHYTEEKNWKAIGYEGPLVGSATTTAPFEARYTSLKAPEGKTP